MGPKSGSLLVAGPGNSITCWLIPENSFFIYNDDSDYKYKQIYRKSRLMAGVVVVVISSGGGEEPIPVNGRCDE